MYLQSRVYYKSARNRIGKSFSLFSPLNYSDVILKLGFVHNELGQLCLSQGRTTKAKYHFSQALDQFCESHSDENIVLVRLNISKCFSSMGHYKAAELEIFLAMEIANRHIHPTHTQRSFASGSSTQSPGSKTQSKTHFGSSSSQTHKPTMITIIDLAKKDLGELKAKMAASLIKSKPNDFNNIYLLFSESIKLLSGKPRNLAPVQWNFGYWLSCQSSLTPEQFSIATRVLRSAQQYYQEQKNINNVVSSILAQARCHLVHFGRQSNSKATMTGLLRGLELLFSLVRFGQFQVDKSRIVGTTTGLFRSVLAANASILSNHSKGSKKWKESQALALKIKSSYRTALQSLSLDAFYFLRAVKSTYDSY